MARPRKRQRDETVARALEVFMQHGAGATPLDDLLARVGIGRGSFYNDFDDKEQLYQETLELFSERFMEGPPGELEGRKTGLPAITALLSRAARDLLRREPPRTCYFMNSVMERGGRDVKTNQAAAAGFERIRAALKRAVVSGQSDKEIRTDVSAEEAAATLLAVAYGMQVMGKAGMGPRVIRQCVRGARALLSPPSPR